MIFILVFAVILTATMGVGVYYSISKPKVDGKRRLKQILFANGVMVSIFLVAFFLSMFSGTIFAAENLSATTQAVTGNSTNLGFIAAAAATGLATLGAGYAVGSVGSSALGAVSENPKILGKTLIFVGLAEGIAIYGLIVSILILGRM